MGTEKIQFERKIHGRKFVRNSLQSLCPGGGILPKPETSIQNRKGRSQASAQGLRANMETMLYGSHFMLVKEAFHIYSSFFKANKDEEAFRDILLHPETGLNVVIMIHPVTLERFNLLL